VLQKNKADGSEGSLKGQDEAPFLPSILIIICMAAGLFLIFNMASSNKAQPPLLPPVQGSMGIELSTDREAYLENDTVYVQALSHCGGNAALSLDGQPLAGDVSNGRFEASVKAGAGTHEIAAMDRTCIAKRNFTVAARECSDGDNRTCIVNGCDGKMLCVGGTFSACALNEHICQPGSRIGCVVDGCRPGYTYCNACGTGFGPCLEGA